MSRLFTPWKLGDLEISNRLVRSATWEGMAEPGGLMNDRLVELYRLLGAADIGLIISGYTYVHPWGQGRSGQTGIYSDECLEGWSKVCRVVHEGGGKIAAQIVHAGGNTRPEWIGGRTPIAPSGLISPNQGLPVDRMNHEQIEEIIKSFAAGAVRAKQAGADAVQLHGAHGYLIAEFLSPNINQRCDEYGGPIENRARFCYRVYDAVRQAVGPDYPVFIKLQSEDGIHGGVVLEDALAVAAELGKRGVDAIEVSGGVNYAGVNRPHRVALKPDQEGYFLANAKAIKEAAGCPVICVGGWRSLARIEEGLQSVDAVSLSRPFIREPNLATRWKNGDQEKAACISCNGCLELTAMKGLGCLVLEKLKGRG